MMERIAGKSLFWGALLLLVDLTYPREMAN